MASAVDQSRTGVLIIRVWGEPGEAGTEVRIRVTTRRDITSDQEETFTASGVDAALRHAEQWLRSFE